MNVMNRMKRETILRLLVPILLLVFFGVLCIAGSNLFAEEPAAQNLYEVPRDQLEGSYVTTEVEWIYANYAYTEEYKNDVATGKITEREYVIDANEEDYCALILEGDLMDQAEALLKECDAYYYGETDEITKGFTVTGWVRTLPSDSLSLYYEIFDYYNLSDAEQEIILPLYIAPADYSIQPVPLVIGAVLLGIAVLLLVLALTGHFQKQVKEKIENSGYGSERFDDLLIHLYKDVPCVAGLRMDSGWILLRHGFSHFLYNSNDLVWAYQQVTRQKLYGVIPIAKNYSLMLKLADGKEKAVPMNQKKIKEQLEIIAGQFPSCAIGYNDQLASLYRTNPNALREVGVAQRRNQNV